MLKTSLLLLVSDFSRYCFFSPQAANPGCLLADFVRWYSPRDWIEGEEEEEREEGGDCPLPDSSRTAASSSPPQQTSSQPEESKNTKGLRDEESLQGASGVARGDTEMETGEAAIESGDAGEGGDGGDGWDNEGWGEEDWDMINDDEEDKSRQKDSDSPSQDVSVTEPPAIKVRMCLTILVQNFSSKGAIHDEILKFRIFSMFKDA